jgi:hypothetical protein
MKGIVFNLLADLVRREHGEDTWDRLIEAAGVDGVYTSLGSYPDSDMTKLVQAAAARLGLPADAVLRWFGRAVLAELANQFPDFFVGHRTLQSFLLTLNDIIHPEVRKLYPGAAVPTFDFDTSSKPVLLMGYTSGRHLCAFGEGLIEGAATYFGEPVHIDQPQCVKRGDAKCVFRIAPTGAAVANAQARRN